MYKRFRAQLQTRIVGSFHAQYLVANLAILTFAFGWLVKNVTFIFMSQFYIESFQLIILGKRVFKYLKFSVCSFNSSTLGIISFLMIDDQYVQLLFVLALNTKLLTSSL